MEKAKERMKKEAQNGKSHILQRLLEKLPVVINVTYIFIKIFRLFSFF